MYFLEERIRHIVNKLKELINRDKLNIPNYKFREVTFSNKPLDCQNEALCLDPLFCENFRHRMIRDGRNSPMALYGAAGISITG